MSAMRHPLNIASTCINVNIPQLSSSVCIRPNTLISLNLIDLFLISILKFSINIKFKK